MSRTRSQSQTTPADTQDKLKHWVYCMGKGIMKQHSDLWIKQRKYTEVERSGGKLFSQIGNADLLHIYGHGNPDKVVIYKAEKELSPQEFLNFLKAEGLPSNHKFLELDACYSDLFAEKLAEIATKDYPELCITGFPKQFVLFQGNKDENLANLEEPFIKSTPQGMILDHNEFKKYPETKKDEFIADKHKKIFYTDPKKNNEIKDPEEKELSIETLSQRITRSLSITTASYSPENTNSVNPPDTPPSSESRYGRGFIFRKPDQQSIPRESIPGRRSWTDVINQSEQKDVNKNAAETSTSTDPKSTTLTNAEKWAKLVQETLDSDNMSENKDSPDAPKPTQRGP